MKWFIAVWHLLSILILSFSMAEANLPDQWQKRNKDFRAVTYGNTIFVAVGEKGAICTSSDGISWQLQTSSTDKTLNGITYGNNLFVAVGGTGTILTSSDGHHWVSQAPLSSETLNGAAFGNGIYTAVGNNGTILTSSNGLSWGQQPSGTTNRLSSVTFGTPGFVAVGQGGTLLKGEGNGTGWLPKSSGTSENLEGVTYGNDQYLAVFADGITTSSQGETWGAQATTFGSTNGVAFGNGIFLVFTSGCLQGDIRFSTNNGTTWNSALARLYYFLSGTWANNRFVVVGNNGNILTSPNGQTWTEQVTGVTTALYGVTNKEGKFVAVGELEDDPDSPSLYYKRDFATILTSEDGIFWRFRDSGTKSTLFGAGQGADQFVTVGRSKNILHSNDGSVWYSAPLSEPDYNYHYGVTYGSQPDRFVAVGGWIISDLLTFPLVATSTDGLGWVSICIAANNHSLYGVTHGNGAVVAVGGEGSIYTATDGVNWNLQISGTSSTLKGVAYGNGRFVAVGDSGPNPGDPAVILTSDNGTTWSPQISGTTHGLKGIAYGPGHFVAVGDTGTILVSEDGQTWTPHTSGTTFNLKSITYGNNSFVVVGDNGLILQCRIPIYLPLIITS